jgi:hypothetical protein
MNLWMLGETDNITDAFENTDALCDLWVSVVGIVTTVIWILVGVLAVILIVKGVTTALAVVKAADEPQVRQEKLGSFKYLAIGLGIAIVVISLANVVVNLILNNGSVGVIGTGTTK